ncbi:MAG: sulfite exporter TauE/SafE family protein [Methanoregula sp.]|nr:sulfite exporter TauE/SafE family protein [Methanoregula sp.]
MIAGILAFLISLAIGVISAILGLGGGFLYVPSLSLVFGLDPKIAIGTSLAIMIFSSCAATIVYLKQKKVIFRISLLLIVPGILFSILGSLFTRFVDARILVGLFVVVLLIMAVQMLAPSFRIIRPLSVGPSCNLDFPGETENSPGARVSYVHLLTWGALGGLVSGVTGISGGIFFVPALIVTGIPVHAAVATSLFAIVVTSVSGAATHTVIGQISLPYLIIYGTGAAVGAGIGACLAPRIRPDHTRKFFGVMLILVALLMIQQKVLCG